MTEKKTIPIPKDSIFNDEEILELFANALGCMKIWATPAQIKLVRRSKVLIELKLKYLNG